MEAKKEKCKKCLYCRNYTAYYIKGIHRFDSIKQGYCCQYKQIVAGFDSCEHWENAYHRFCIRKKATLKTLYELLTKLSAIHQILEECRDEGKNYNE